LYTCHNQSFEWYIKAIGEIIKTNSLGKIFDIEVERSLPTAFSMNENDWRNNSEKCPTGPLLQLGIHFIDFLNEWFGEFEIIQSHLSSFVVKNDDYFNALISYEGIFCKLKFSYISNNIFKILINAQNFNIFFDGRELKKIYHNGKVVLIKSKVNDSLQESIDEFYKFIKEKNIQSNTNRAIASIKSIEELRKQCKK
jgi:predicted dehydrogenase